MSDATMTADDALEGVAIIGMSGRFPGAGGVREFWENLCGGRESIRTFSRGEAERDGRTARLLDDPCFVPAGGALDDVEGFDAPFFGFTPRDAELTDPQQRLFLECAWEAMEDAGYDPGAMPGRVAVYAGSSLSTYLLNHLAPSPGLLEEAGLSAILGNDAGYLATRVSYKLNLTGPSVSVSTTCSTSLVAVHLACQALLTYGADVALAGGASVRLPQRGGYLYQDGGIVSPDGHCRPFDARARGTVPGNGAGAVVLKRLADALADGDHVWAVIRATAINNDGSAKIGFTAPSADGQAAVIAEALALAGAAPESISFVEAHGTGTALGDPIEFQALRRVFGDARPGGCALGSVKGNVGHLDAAAGVTGLIKTALALHHGAIPPTVHFERPNPELGLEASSFHVPTHLLPWKSDGAPRRAGVSSFGLGGTNAHAVLEEAPAVRRPPAAPRAETLLLLSARSESALEAASARLAKHLRVSAGGELADVAFTLHAGRRGFAHRRAVVCGSPAGGAGLLERPDPSRVVTDAAPAAPRGVVFLFPGQGAQFAGIARGLFQAEPVFRDAMERCLAVLAGELSFDLRELLLDADGADERITRTEAAQPALFVAEYALAALLQSYGVQPAALAGHSVGELVAATLAGVFTLDDALRLVAARGRLVQALPAGAMLAVPLDEAHLLSLLDDGLAVAAANAPGRCVVAGPAEAVERLRARLEAEGHSCRRLPVSHAFHSAMMEPAAARFAEEVARVPRQAPRIPFLSNVTGSWITDAEALDPGYWGRHLRATVRFADGLRAASESGDHAFVEVGPGTALTAFVKRTVPGGAAVAAMRGRDERVTEVEAALRAVGALWAAGATVDAKALHGPRRRVPLPTYPFERRRHWIDAPARTDAPEAPPRLQAETVEAPAAPAAFAHDPVARVVAEVWRELLGMDARPGENFFHLGADSLTATNLVARLHKRFPVEIPLRAVFEEPTVEGLAEVITARLVEKLDTLTEEEVEALL